MKRILSVRIRREHDDNPDTSWIGTYSNKPGPSDRTIDRTSRGDRGNGELRYFIAANSAADTGNDESVEQDYQRMESYNKGAWGLIGMWAEATIQLTEATTHTISSGGLWGIESDSSSDYLKSVQQEELTTLATELRAISFSDEAIHEALEGL